MQEPEWDPDHLSYLVGHLVLLAADEAGGFVVSSAFRFVQHALLEKTSPFESWSEERRLRIAREAMISLARDGLAEFSEDQPLNKTPHWVPGPIRRFIFRMAWDPSWSWERAEAWHREHLLSASEVVAMLDRNVELWWAGQLGGPHYWYSLTDEGMTHSERLSTSFLTDLAARGEGSAASAT